MSRSRWQGGLRCVTALATLLGIVDSNPTGNMDVCLLWMFCFFLVDVSDLSSGGVLPSVVCPIVISKFRDRRLWPNLGPKLYRQGKKYNWLPERNSISHVYDRF